MVGKKVLLVEGPDDEHVVKHICNVRGITRLDEIIASGGIDKLLESFPVRLKASGVESIGVIVDADISMNNRWRSLKEHLKKAGYNNVPMNPNSSGTILSPPSNSILPRAGIWLMPDNKNKGILEDFLHFLIPSDSSLLQHAKNSIKGIPKSELRFKKKENSKALIHTWLAWQEEPGKPLGISITAKYLSHDVPEVDTFVNWIKQLFFRS